jgi:hypothetical protein
MLLLALEGTNWITVQQYVQGLDGNNTKPTYKTTTREM